MNKDEKKEELEIAETDKLRARHCVSRPKGHTALNFAEHQHFVF